MNIFILCLFWIFQIIQAQNQVTICSSNCVDCDTSTNICFACQQNYQLTINSTCFSQIIDYCVLYGVNRQCLKCQPTYRLSNSLCVKQYSGCLIYNIDGTCQKCLSGFNLKSGKCLGVFNCKNFTDLCVQCYSGFILSNNKCIDNTGKCQNFNQNLGVCTDCVNGFQLIGVQCVSTNIYPFACQIYNDTGACLICKDGYILFSIFCYTSSEIKSLSNGISLSPRRIYMVQSSSLSSEINISSAAAQNQIIQKYINGLSNSSLTNYNKKQIPIANCIDYNQLNKTCNFCQTNYVLVQNNCFYKIIGCINYIPSLSGIKCSQCDKNYQLDTSGVCYQKLNSSNIVNCLISNLKSLPQVCIVCNYGYYLIKGNCYTTLNPNITETNTSESTAKNTTDSSLTTVSNSTTKSSLNSSQSTTITNNYTNNLTTLKNISEKQTTNIGTIFEQTDPNCLQFYTDKKQYCKSCIKNYFLNILSGRCQQINPLCKTYDLNNGQCLSCYSGYSLKLGDCILTTNFSNLSSDLNCKSSLNNSCIQCYKGFYLNNFMVCKQMNPICKTVNSSGQCTSCYQGYWLVNGNCTTQKSIISQSQSYDQNCKNVTNLVCLQCYPGYRLSNNACLISNPICKTIDLNNGQCLSCYEGYYLNQGQCYINESNTPNLLDPYCTKLLNLECMECVQGYYVSQKDGSCTSIDTNCQTINLNDGSCKSCNFGYVLADGSCYQQTSNCVKVDTNGKCINCTIGYYLKQFQCYPKSTSCIYYDQKTGNCAQCIANYILFKNDCIFPTFGFDPLCQEYVNSYCTACLKGSYLLNYRCRKISPDCLEFDYKKLKCQKCAQNLSPKGVNCA